MLRRSLVRQSRHLLSFSCQNPAPLAVRSHFPPIRLSPIPDITVAPRFYTTATESSSPDASSEPPSPGPAPSGEAAQATEVDPAKRELETKSREIIDLKDKYLRSVAEFRNLQDRTQRDIKQARQFAITGFAKDLIESVDNLDRALSTVDPNSLPSDEGQEGSGEGGNKELNNLYQGLKMTDDILMQTLKKHGLERFDPSGERFDPNLHDAAFMTKMEGKEDGTVFDTIQKGFSLNGRVIRAAKVGVVKNS